MEIQSEIELLLQLDEAYNTPDPKDGKRKAIERYGVEQTSFVMHHALPHGFKIDEEELRFLDREGLVDCELTRGADGETIRPTRAGHQLAESMRALEGDQQAPEGAAVALGWADVARPTLEAAHQVWTSWGAPPSGVPIQAVAREMGREEDDAKTYRAVDLLHDRGYLGAPSGASVNDAPALLTVTPLGLEVVGG